MNTVLAFMPFGMPGPMELMIIFVIIFFLFGAKKLPSIAKSFGESLTSFRRGKKEGEKLLKEIDDELKDKPKEKEDK